MGIIVNAGKMPVFQRIRQKGLKSREEKMERQQNRDNQVAVLEKHKADLKNKECGSVEEIEDKLGLLHSYEDQIRMVKQAYNLEQMRHILDEAREKGEKMAEELKKLAPKTEEERKKALREEALGIEENQGMLSELLDELTEEVTGGLTEEVVKEVPDGSPEKIADELSEEEIDEPNAEATDGLPEEETDRLTEEITDGLSEKTADRLPEKVIDGSSAEAAEELLDRLTGETADKLVIESAEIPAENIEAALSEREAEKLAKRHNADL